MIIFRVRMCLFSQLLSIVGLFILQYLSNTPSWLHSITMDNGRRMSQYSADELEAAIAEHERFGEMFLQTYAEVKLTKFLMLFKEKLSIGICEMPSLYDLN